MIGRTLNHYIVESRLGSGGMGEVYRARDTNLRREVAIKVLSRALARDAQYLERFRREAQLLAALNHPNVATIYGLEEATGEVFLAMELVPGTTLREFIDGKRYDLTRAVDIGRQVADAVQAAHQKGVVHRDLKPANIKITPGGVVKVLDFGLAKSFRSGNDSQPDGDRPTVVSDVTATGIAMGTPGYMSPEQFHGEDVDRRSDVWAFGCVLFELVSRQPAFGGQTPSERSKASLTQEPDWTRLPAATPAALTRIVRRCLAKDPSRRYQDFGDVRLDLDEALTEESPPDQPRRSAGAKRLAPLVAVMLLLATGLYFLSARTANVNGWSGELLGGPGKAIGPRVSPDGETLAFQAWDAAGQNQVAVLKPASGYWSVLTSQKADGTTMDISWSRDGTRIYFDRFGKGIYSIPAVGGEPRLVVENALGPQAIENGSLLFTRMNEKGHNQLYRLWPDGRVEPLAALLPPTGEAWAPPVRVFPDGKEAVYFGRMLSEPEAQNALYKIDLASNRSTRLAPDVVIRPASEYFALSVDPSGEAVLVDVPTGDLHNILEVPRDGSNRTRIILTLVTAPWFLDASRDGSIYVDQVDRPFEILRFPTSGGVPEQVGVAPNFFNYFRGGAISLPDGRVLMPSSSGGRYRLLVTGSGGRLLPFIETTAETSGPVAVLGGRETALLEGTGSRRVIAVASIPDDRIVRRLKTPPGEVTAMAASQDGSTIYAVISKEVWAIPSQDHAQSEPKKIRVGDGVAVDPRNGNLIIQVFSADGGTRLFRRPADGSPEQEIPISHPTFITYPIPLSANAIAPDGRILIHGGSMDTWNFRVGILDPLKKLVEVVPLEFKGDPASPGWTSDGRIVSVGLEYRMNVWRFKRISR